MKKFVLGASTALAALSFLGSPAAAQMPGAMPPQPVVMGDGTGMAAPEPTGAYTTLSGTGGVNAASKLYVEASYLLMFVSDNRSQTPIATGGPSNGVIGRPGTTLLTDTSTNYHTLSGFKIGVGGLVGATSLGFELSGMAFGRTSDTTSLGPVATGVLARPFFDPAARRESSVVVSSPGAFTGSLEVQSSTTAWGAEANPFFRVVQGNSVNFDLITGFRYFSVDEGFTVYDSRRVLAGGVAAFDGLGVGNGASLLIQDRISARNQFFGGNIGGRMSYSGGRFFIDGTAKVAIGGVHQIVTVDGTTTLTGGGLVGPATTAGGVLANLANGGRTSENRFAVLPEANFQVGYQLRSWANVFAGYQVLYMSNMARAGDQVDRNINANRLPTVNTFNTRGLVSTTASTNSGDLFLHGFNFGFTLTY